MRVEFSVDIKRCLREIRDFDRIRRIYQGNPRYFFNHFPDLEGKSTEEIIEFFEDNREEIERKLLKRKNAIEKAWREINDLFFSEIERITGQKWRFRRYECHLCSVWAGAYDIYKNNISVFGFFSKADYLATIAEELLHLHFWEILKKFGIRMEDKDWDNFEENFYWQLSECIPCLIFSHSDVRLRLKFGKYPDWKELKGLFKKVKPKWKTRKGFMDFLKNVLKPL